MGMCGKCKKMSGMLLVLLGIIFLLVDLGIWGFWGVNWWTTLILFFGLTKWYSSYCPICKSACCSVETAPKVKKK